VEGDKSRKTQKDEGQKKNGYLSSLAGGREKERTGERALYFKKEKTETIGPQDQLIGKYVPGPGSRTLGAWVWKEMAGKKTAQAMAVRKLKTQAKTKNARISHRSKNSDSVRINP